MHRTVAFVSDEPLDWDYDHAGDPVGPGGRALTERIAAALAAAGCQASTVEQHEDFGWGFSARFGDEGFYQVLNPVERDAYLTIEMGGFLLKRLLGRRPELAFERYCGLVGAALASMPGIRDVQWEEQGKT
jgi:hypothetical protein